MGEIVTKIDQRPTCEGDLYEKRPLLPLAQPLIQISQLKKVLGYPPSKECGCGEEIPEYDDAVQLPIKIGSRIKFRAENDDMATGFEEDMGTVVETHEKWVIICWDGDREDKKWTKKYELPLSLDFMLC